MSTEPLTQDHKLNFVQSLSEDLSRGSIELPSFPDVVIRLRQILEDENSTTAQIVQLLTAEPVLAARLVQMANSAALRGEASEMTDLKMVVNRLGRNMVRNSAMAYAMKQMRETQKLESAQPYLEALWNDSTHLAALCYVLTKKLTKLNPEQALLVGLLHGIGKLYILAQAETHPALFENEAQLSEILDSWHAAIGSAILDAWQFPEEVSGSVASYQEVEREHETALADPDVELDLAPGRQRVDHARHRAELVRSVEGDHAGGRGGHRDRDRIPATQSESGQRIGETVDPIA